MKKATFKLKPKLILSPKPKMKLSPKAIVQPSKVKYTASKNK